MLYVWGSWVNIVDLAIVLGPLFGLALLGPNGAGKSTTFDVIRTFSNLQLCRTLLTLGLVYREVMLHRREETSWDMLKFRPGAPVDQLSGMWRIHMNPASVHPSPYLVRQIPGYR